VINDVDGKGVGCQTLLKMSGHLSLAREAPPPAKQGAGEDMPFSACVSNDRGA